jgi:hypothetical protein
MRSGRSNNVRAAALVLALVVNALFLLLLVFNRASTPPEPATTAMMWIVAALEQSRPQARRSLPRTEVRRAQASAQVAVTVSATALLEALPASVDESPAGATLPSIDWYAEAEKAARNLTRNAERDRADSAPDSSSGVQVRPESFWIPPMKGRTEQMPGGGTRVWTSDLCYREYNPLDPDPFTGGFRKGGRTVCKPRSMAERQSEARAEAIADAVRRKRSAVQLEPALDAPGPVVPVP